MIFGSIGASINFSQLPASVVGRAALIVVTGGRPAARERARPAALCLLRESLGACCGSGPPSPGNLSCVRWPAARAHPRAQSARGGSTKRAGLAVRMIATYITMFGREGRAGDHPYSHRSRLFFAVAWSPKATVQAALSAAPLHLVRILKKGQPDYEQWMEWGREVQATGALGNEGAIIRARARASAPSNQGRGRPPRPAPPRPGAVAGAERRSRRERLAGSRPLAAACTT